LDDCVGLFLAPDRGDTTVFQIYVNAEGVVFDQSIVFDENMRYRTDPSWNGQYEVVAARGDEGWAVEIKIPFRELGVDVARGHTWGLNFRRKQQRVRGAADWQVPIDYDPRTFGKIRFE